MKKYLVSIILVVALGVHAQEVSTLYFLENAPMRHLVNPAFQPVSNGYLNFTPLGYTSVGAGNNALTFSDFVYAAPNGSTVTILHPEYGNRDHFLKMLPQNIYAQQDATLNWLGFGFRVKEKGYFTFQAMTKVDSKERMSSSVFSTLLNGASVSTPTSTSHFDLGSSSLATQVYTEVGFGYSHKINDVWTVGGKLKILLGTAYIGTDFPQMDITGSTQSLQVKSQGDVLVAGPINFAALPSQITYKTFGAINLNALLWGDLDMTDQILNFVKPSGYGGAIDLGFTATPLKQLQISVGLNDLGFIYWNNANQFKASIDTTFNGVGPFNYSDYFHDGQLMIDSIASTALNQLKGLADAVRLSNPANKFCRMVTTKLNVGIDGRFFDNRLSVGILSKTMLYNGHLNEEVTFGVAGKPANWFNIALSYSLLNNGKYSNIGAGLSFMPYDGINLTLAADYIPLHYASLYGLDVLPTRSKGLNIALGFSIVWGTNHKKGNKTPMPELEMVEQPTEEPIAEAVAEPIVEQSKEIKTTKNNN